MCWTMTTGAGKSADNLATIRLHACKPPADAATTTALKAMSRCSIHCLLPIGILSTSVMASWRRRSSSLIAMLPVFAGTHNFFAVAAHSYAFAVFSLPPTACMLNNVGFTPL